MGRPQEAAALSAVHQKLSLKADIQGTLGKHLKKQDSTTTKILDKTLGDFCKLMSASYEHFLKKQDEWMENGKY